MGIDGEHRVTAALGSRMPVGARRSAPRSRGARLIAQVDANDSGVAQVARGQCLPVGDPVSFRVATVVPKLIVIGGAAAPAGIAHVIVKNDHDAGAGEGVDHGVENGESVFAVRGSCSR